MCLGVPGRILKTWAADDGQVLAEADFVGEVRTIRLNYLPDLAVGDHTIVHAGYALTKLTPEDAAETIRTMREVGLLPDAEPDSGLIRGVNDTKPVSVTPRTGGGGGMP